VLKPNDQPVVRAGVLPEPRFETLTDEQGRVVCERYVFFKTEDSSGMGIAYAAAARNNQAEDGTDFTDWGVDVYFDDSSGSIVEATTAGLFGVAVVSASLKAQELNAELVR
jgi:hypothetical protein